MPKLLGFLACERVIIDENGVGSLIAVMYGVTGTSSDDVIPRNAVTPKEWAIYTSWLQEQGDEGKSFTQELEVFWPDGGKFHRHSLPFKIPKQHHQNRVGFRGFPIGQTGLLKIDMWIESGGDKISQTYTLTLEVKHENPETG